MISISESVPRKVASPIRVVRVIDVMRSLDIKVSIKSRYIGSLRHVLGSTHRHYDESDKAVDP